MDKLFPLDDDIIGSESDAYKSFQLVDQWRVSPPNTGHFSLPSPELTFPASSADYLEKINVPCEIEKDSIEVKQEVKEEPTSPVHWLSVLENKQHCPWRRSVDNSFQERYLAEQVVPDQVSAMDFTEQKNNVLQTRRGETFEFSKRQSRPENVFIDLKNPSMNAVNSPLKTGVISENLSNSQFSPDHKEQVKGRAGEKGFVLGPVLDMFTYDTLCENEHLEQAAKNNDISDFGKLKVEENLSNGSKQTVEQEESHSNGELEDGSQLFTSDNSSDSSRPEEIINYANLEVKLEKEEKRLCINKHLSQNPNEDDLIYKKLMKFLIPKRIPKCMMVEYEFGSNEKLPSFKDIFCPEQLNAVERPTMELPDVLKSQEIDNNDEEDSYIVLSDTESEYESMDVENNEMEPVALSEIDSSLVDNVKSVELQTVALNHRDELTSEFHSKAESKDLHNVHEPTSNILTLDDELENFLVSNMVLAGDQNGGSAQLPDLSDNLGSILRNDNMNEDNHLDSIYRNLFPRNGYPLEADSMWYKTPRGDQSKLQLQGYDGYGNFVNPTGLPCSGERTWQEHINRENLNAMYGNVWTRNTTTEAYLHQLGARHFTNNRIFHATEPFLHGVPKNVPSDVIQTEIDGFKFSNSAARVEVVDSSLNYEF